jgi:hypothetical protein
VEVTLNGQQFHGQESQFDFYSPPTVLSMSPSSGTVHGNTLVTIVGHGFRHAFNHMCQWGNLTTNVSELNSTHIICPTPQTRAGLSLVEVTLNGQQFTADMRSFYHYLHPHVHRLTAPGEVGAPGTWIEEMVTLPQAGFIMAHIWGSGFMGGTDYRCRINEHEPITATYDAQSDSIRCWSDSWVRTNHIEITLNGREYTSDGLSLLINHFWLGHTVD